MKVVLSSKQTQTLWLHIPSMVPFFKKSSFKNSSESKVQAVFKDESETAKFSTIANALPDK